jgi:hypothetical protein
MYEKRERQRLNELFSGLERPELDPSVNVLELLSESEAAPSGNTELEKPFLDYPIAIIDVEAETPASPRAEAQSPEVFILNEPEPAVILVPAAEMEVLPHSAAALPAISKVITSPLNNGPRNSAEPGRQLTEVEMSTLTWQAVGMGILIGTLVTGVVLALTAHLDIFGKWGRYALAGGEVLFATLGALFNISSRKTKRAMWIGAAGWSLIPLFAALVFILLLTMVMFTNFFGV